jgi:hypothetical protein
MKEKYVAMKIILVAAVLLACIGCAPSSFVKSSPGWKVIEVREGLNTECDKAWQTTVDTIARNWDIEMIDKESGYLRTTWTYGISGGIYNRYRARLTVKFPGGFQSGRQCDKMEVKTEAQWLQNIEYGNWVTGFDTTFNRDVYGALAGRLGRTVPTE